MKLFIMLLLLAIPVAGWGADEKLVGKDVIYQDIAMDGAVYVVKSTNKIHKYFWYMGGARCVATVDRPVVSVVCPDKTFTTSWDSDDVVMKVGGKIMATSVEGTLFFEMHSKTLKHDSPFFGQFRDE